jgi:hypothetical protein
LTDLKSDGALFDRPTIERLIAELGSRCAARGLTVEMFLVGGAAMALAYSRERVTRDLDAVFEPKMAVYEEARHLADEHGLPADWLNDAVKGFMPDREDDGEQVCFSSVGISVAVASPSYLFAMKAVSARPEDDGDDLLALARILRITDAEQAFAVLERFYRPQRLPAKTSLFVESLLGAGAGARGERHLEPRPGKVFVSSHIRNGRYVAGYWRRS